MATSSLGEAELVGQTRAVGGTIGQQLTVAAWHSAWGQPWASRGLRGHPWVLASRCQAPGSAPGWQGSLGSSPTPGW